MFTCARYIYATDGSCQQTFIQLPIYASLVIHNAEVPPDKRDQDTIMVYIRCEHESPQFLATSSTNGVSSHKCRWRGQLEVPRNSLVASMTQYPELSRRWVNRLPLGVRSNEGVKSEISMAKLVANMVSVNLTCHRSSELSTPPNAIPVGYQYDAYDGHCHVVGPKKHGGHYGEAVVQAALSTFGHLSVLPGLSHYENYVGLLRSNPTTSPLMSQINSDNLFAAHLQKLHRKMKKSDLTVPVAELPMRAYIYVDRSEPHIVDPTTPIVYEKHISGSTFRFVTSKMQLKHAASKLAIYVDATFGIVDESHARKNVLFGINVQNVVLGRDGPEIHYVNIATGLASHESCRTLQALLSIYNEVTYGLLGVLPGFVYMQVDGTTGASTALRITSPPCLFPICKMKVVCIFHLMQGVGRKTKLLVMWSVRVNASNGQTYTFPEIFYEVVLNLAKTKSAGELFHSWASHKADLLDKFIDPKAKVFVKWFERTWVKSPDRGYTNWNAQSQSVIDYWTAETVGKTNNCSESTFNVLKRRLDQAGIRLNANDLTKFLSDIWTPLQIEKIVADTAAGQSGQSAKLTCYSVGQWSVMTMLKQLFDASTPEFNSWTMFGGNRKVNGDYFMFCTTTGRLRFLKPEVANKLDFTHADCDRHFYDGFKLNIEPNCAIIRFKHGSTAGRSFRHAECNCDSYWNSVNHVCPHIVLLYRLFCDNISDPVPNPCRIQETLRHLQAKPTRLIDFYTYQLLTGASSDRTVTSTATSSSQLHDIARSLNDSNRVSSSLMFNELPEVRAPTEQEKRDEEERAEFMLCTRDYAMHWTERRAEARTASYTEDYASKWESYTRYLELLHESQPHDAVVPPEDMSQSRIVGLIHGSCPGINLPQPTPRSNPSAVGQQRYLTNGAKKLMEFKKAERNAEASLIQDNDVVPDVDSDYSGYIDSGDEGSASSSSPSSSEQGGSNNQHVDVATLEVLEGNENDGVEAGENRDYDSPSESPRVDRHMETPPTASTSSSRQNAGKRCRPSVAYTPRTEDTAETPSTPETPKPKRGRPKGVKDSKTRIGKCQSDAWKRKHGVTV